jgi:hypothetical protein
VLAGVMPLDCFVEGAVDIGVYGEVSGVDGEAVAELMVRF